MAQEEITSYLRPRGYDVAAVFSASGDSRNPLIIMYMIDMALYHLHSSLAGRAIPKNREDRYRAALEWLTQVNHDKLDPTLPKLPDPNTDPSWRFGNNGQYSVAWWWGGGVCEWGVVSVLYVVRWELGGEYQVASI